MMSSRSSRAVFLWANRCRRCRPLSSSSSSSPLSLSSSAEFSLPARPPPRHRVRAAAPRRTLATSRQRRADMEKRTSPSPPAADDDDGGAGKRPNEPAPLTSASLVLPPPTSSERRALLPGGFAPPGKVPLPFPPPPIPEANPSGVSNADASDVVDLSSMYDPAIHLPDAPDFNSPRNRRRYETGTPLCDDLIARIAVGGPVTAAEYMRKALGDPMHGYYTQKAAGAASPAGVVGAVGNDGAAEEFDDSEGDVVGFGEGGVDNEWDDDNDGAVASEGAAGGAGDAVIGLYGDFVTAPEVSQLFGESLLVWFLTQYRAMGRPSRIQLVEIGPGKGTLVCDVLRSAILSFEDFAESLSTTTGGVGGMGNAAATAVSVHLVEVAGGMRGRQRKAIEDLAGEASVKERGYVFRFFHDDNDGAANANANGEGDVRDSVRDDAVAATPVEGGKTITVRWHDDLSSVPTHESSTSDGSTASSDGGGDSGEKSTPKPIPTFVICQELIDALPVHSFQKVEGGDAGLWRERLVDVAVRDEEDDKDEEEKRKTALLDRGGGDDASKAIASATGTGRGVRRNYSAAEEAGGDPSTSPQSPPAAGPSPPSDTPPPDGRKLPRLRFVLPPDTTPAVRSLLRVDRRGAPTGPNSSALNALPVGAVVEACPEGMAIAQDVADMVETCGGAALIVDYGEEGARDTMRGFRRHEQFHPLSRPGEVDVTADVDFSALREAVNNRRRGGEDAGSGSVEGGGAPRAEREGDRSREVHAFGPVPQGKFLASMGVMERAVRFIEEDSTTDEKAEEVFAALERLVDPEEMGKRYKVLAIAKKKDGIFPPPAF